MFLLMLLMLKDDDDDAVALGMLFFFFATRSRLWFGCLVLLKEETSNADFKECVEKDIYL